MYRKIYQILEETGKVTMTSGGPGEDTALIAYRITTEAFTNLNVGYASALAMLLFVVMAVFSWLNIRVMNKIDN